MKPKLLPQEIRHLLDLLLFEKRGRYDPESNRWTYPEDIRGKLRKMVAAAIKEAK